MPEDDGPGGHPPPPPPFCPICGKQHIGPCQETDLPPDEPPA